MIKVSILQERTDAFSVRLPTVVAQCCARPGAATCISAAAPAVGTEVRPLARLDRGIKSEVHVDQIEGLAAVAHDAVPMTDSWRCRGFLREAAASQLHNAIQQFSWDGGRGDIDKGGLSAERGHPSQHQADVLSQLENLAVGRKKMAVYSV